ncbi:unnamed protein product [Durusdinium trenchii]|uniref:Plastid lipid-associated protein/fibrillin conserved domain-containing protein n=2 Tax=Durusdinium trenchii TaxID=1381693 RepID=A0ABP0PGF2_9DINO
MAPVTCDRPRVHRRVLLVAVLGSLLRGLSFTFWSSALEGTRAGPASAIARRASKEESQVLKLCDEYPLNDADIDDQEEMMTAVKKLPEAPDDCYQLFLGDWKVEWSSMGGKAAKKKPDPNGPPQRLNFVSFMALPPVDVEFTGSFNRVSGDGEGGTYQLLQTFTIPDNDGVEAAMVLEGEWSTGSSSGPWGEGAPRKRVPTEFKTVRLVPSASDTEKSKEMLEKAGLGKFFERTPVKARATYIDLKQISDEMRTHQGESGAWYILTKMDDGSIPFLLD